MFIQLARTLFSLDFKSCINRIEHSAHIHICDVIILLFILFSANRFNLCNKDFFTLALASILLLSLGIFTHNASAETVISTSPLDSQTTTVIHHGDSISKIHSAVNVKHANTHSNMINNAMHIKSPTHIPPSIIQHFIESKICKCTNQKSIHEISDILLLLYNWSLS